MSEERSDKDGVLNVYSVVLGFFGALFILFLFNIFPETIIQENIVLLFLLIILYCIFLLSMNNDLSGRFITLSLIFFALAVATYFTKESVYNLVEFVLALFILLIISAFEIKKELSRVLLFSLLLFVIVMIPAWTYYEDTEELKKDKQSYCEFVHKEEKGKEYLTLILKEDSAILKSLKRYGVLKTKEGEKSFYQLKGYYLAPKLEDFNIWTGKFSEKKIAFNLQPGDKVEIRRYWNKFELPMP